MRRFALLLGFVISGLCLGLLQAQEKSQADVEKYILESEQRWADAAKNRDAASIDRILAADFLGVNPDGTTYTKIDEIAHVKQGNDDVLSNHVNTVKIRFFGDTAVAQGSETWEHRNGEPKRGTYAWTDTWIKRNGKWQIVAAEDLLVPASR